MRDDEQGLEAQTPTDAAAYIAELAANLSSMARKQQLELLAYLLEMVRLEATNLNRPTEQRD
jgi:hypothetical protein